MKAASETDINAAGIPIQALEPEVDIICKYVCSQAASRRNGDRSNHQEYDNAVECKSKEGIRNEEYRCLTQLKTLGASGTRGQTGDRQYS